jgi:ABC-type uncharacterized transport system permease subunit
VIADPAQLMPTFLYLAVALIYAAVALFFWRRAYTVDSHSPSVADDNAVKISHWVILAGVILHGWILLRAVFVEQGMNLGIGNAISLIVWLMVLIYWLGSWIYPLVSCQMFVLPIAVLAVLFALLAPSDRILPIASRPALMAHLVLSLLAYSLFTIAALHAILTSSLDRSLRQGNTPVALRDAPPLIALETLLLRIIQIGFVLLTLALASGFVFSEQVFGKAITFPHNTHKVVFGVLSWLIYGAFLVGHRFYGWRGRTAVLLTLVGFALLLLSYVGSKLVLEVILQRA